LFASYRVEISFDLSISNLTLPGIAVPAKLAVAQISEGLGSCTDFVLKLKATRNPTVVIMLGILGREEPLLSFVDWSSIKVEVEAVS
jgi:hypothetical protein